LKQIPSFSKTYYQQDGAPPHWATSVRKFLDQHFPGRWIGRNGPIIWAPRSLDLTPSDYFAWGYIKDQVFASPISSIKELKEKIRTVASTITAHMLQKAFENFKKRLQLCYDVEGQHFEQLL